MKLAFVDRWVIGYSVATSAAAAIWAHNPAAFAGSHLFHAAAVALVLAIARWVPTTGRFWPLLRHGYPMVLLGLFYRDTGPYVTLFFDKWFDPQLLAWEVSVLGFSMPHAIARLDATWLLELWMAGYGFYYLMLPTVLAVAIWKRDTLHFRMFNEAAVIVYFISFALFAVFPLEGPRYALVSVLPPLKGGVFFSFVMGVQNAGSIHGGCMPSSHTALAWVVTWYVCRMERRVGLILIPISALLTVGCFWGRFHYLTDVVVGLILFVLAIAFTEYRNRGVRPGAVRV